MNENIVLNSTQVLFSKPENFIYLVHQVLTTFFTKWYTNDGQNVIGIIIIIYYFKLFFSKFL